MMKNFLTFNFASSKSDNKFSQCKIDMPTKEIRSVRNCFRILSLFNKQNPNLDADEN